MKAVDVIEYKGQRNDGDQQRGHVPQAYLMMMDSITLATSSHLSVAISIT
jgi:hypothetical protein